MTDFAPLPDPPYYAVIFAARLGGNDRGYAEMAARMESRALTRSGCIGLETTRNAAGFGITVSYWRDEAAMLDWKADAEHMLAQKLGRERWYDRYQLRVARVERHYAGPEGRG